MALGRPAFRRNRAYTLDAIVGRGAASFSPFAAARLSLASKRSGVCSLVSFQDNRIRGLAAGRKRSGATVWELSHLLVARDGLGAAAALLERFCQHVALRGGHRVFVRLPMSDDLVAEARRSGFIRCTEELVYGGVSAGDTGAVPSGLRGKSPADEFGLFSLYSASTPVEERAAGGMTFDQWRSAKERSKGSKEFVIETGGRVAAWLRVVRHRRSVVMEMTVHPRRSDRAGEIMDFGLGLVQSGGTVLFLLGGYQTDLQSLLSDRGFEVESEFVTMASSMVATARPTERRGRGKHSPHVEPGHAIRRYRPRLNGIPN